MSLAFTTLLFALFLSEIQLLEFHAVLLTLIAAVYIGFALQDRLGSGLRLELTAAAGFVVLALLGLWLSPWLIVAGLGLHGCWDILHHNGVGVIKTRVPQWYIPFCVGYDWLLALFLGVWFSL